MSRPHPSKSAGGSLGLGNPRKNAPKNAGWIDKIRLVFQPLNNTPSPLKYCKLGLLTEAATETSPD